MIEKVLAAETLEELSKRGYELEDISAVDGHDFTIPPDRFWQLANVVYDADYGVASVADDLTLWMADGAMFYRYVNDGSERWEYIPPIPSSMRDVTAITSAQAGISIAASLARLNIREESKGDPSKA